jgi:hypothetical protein
MKDILIQTAIDRRSKWIAKILEFDLEIKPTKILKGQGLASCWNNLILKLWGLTSSTIAQKVIKLSFLIKIHRIALHWQNVPGTKILYFFCKS